MKWGIEELLLLSFCHECEGIIWDTEGTCICSLQAEPLWTTASTRERTGAPSSRDRRNSVCGSVWCPHMLKDPHHKIQTHRSLEPLERLDEVGRHEDFCCQWVNESICLGTSWLIFSAYGLWIWEFGSCQCTHLCTCYHLLSFAHFATLFDNFEAFSAHVLVSSHASCAMVHSFCCGWVFSQPTAEHWTLLHINGVEKYQKDTISGVCGISEPSSVFAWLLKSHCVAIGMQTSQARKPWIHWKIRFSLETNASRVCWLDMNCKRSSFNFIRERVYRPLKRHSGSLLWLLKGKMSFWRYVLECSSLPSSFIRSYVFLWNQMIFGVRCRGWKRTPCCVTWSLSRMAALRWITIGWWCEPGQLQLLLRNHRSFKRLCPQW